jgi:haloalkane dehalogenase
VTERLPPPDLPDWLSEQLPFDRYRVEVGDGLQMHVMEQGEGRPVVLFHGNPTWGYLYRRVAAELVGEPIRLIMPDMVGLGFSDRPPMTSDHSLENHSRWMSALVARLELDNAVAVVQDWGGAVGLLAMKNNPGLMSGLVVLNTQLGPPKPGFTPTTFHRILSSRPGRFVPWQNYLRFAQGDRRSIEGVVQKSYSYPLRRTQGGSDAAAALIRMVPDSLDHPSVPLLKDLETFVATISQPSAIVWGQKDPVLGKILRRISRQLPDAAVTATDAGHFLQEEVPMEIAAAIQSVVSRI